MRISLGMWRGIGLKEAAETARLAASQAQHGAIRGIIAEFAWVGRNDDPTSLPNWLSLTRASMLAMVGRAQGAVHTPKARRVQYLTPMARARS